MPRIKTAALTASGIRKLTAPGDYADGLGLALRIKPNGSKSWIQRVSIGGKRHNLGLGVYPATGLADARQAAADNQQAIREGRNPIQDKQDSKQDAAPAPAIPTFEQTAEKVWELNRPSWKSEQHACEWISSMRTHVFPTIGRKPIDAITPADILEILEPIWHCKGETAARIKQRTEQVFDYAIARQHRIDNPVSAVRKAMPKQANKRVNFAAVDYQDLPAVIQAIRKSGNPITRLAVEFLTLTACRSNEVRGAVWSEVNWESATWEIPAARMKAGKAHNIPLSARALEILRAAWAITGGVDGLVFPSARDASKPMTPSELARVLHRSGISETIHGMRAAFRSWAQEQTSASWAACELSLADSIGNATELAYARAEMLEQRRALMQQWADYLAG